MLGAATAFYAMLSVAPLLLMSVWITSYVIDEEEARTRIIDDAALWVGEDGRHLLTELLRNLDESRGGALAGIVSVGTLVWAATRLFSQLRYSLNHLWGVREVSEPGWSRTALTQARKRLAALSMVVVAIAALVTMVLAKIGLATAEAWLETPLQPRWHLLELTTSFLVATVLFAAVFKILPAVHLSWRDACVGALVTAVLFTAGAVAVGWYLGFTGTRSTYGAAGSVVALLLWVYYSSQAFFLGAAFTRTFAERYGAGLPLDPGAVRIVEQTG